MIKKISNEAIKYFKKAMQNEKNQEFKLAIENYTNAIKLDNNFANAYNNRGLVYAINN